MQAALGVMDVCTDLRVPLIFVTPAWTVARRLPQVRLREAQGLLLTSVREGRGCLAVAAGGALAPAASACVSRCAYEDGSVRFPLHHHLPFDLVKYLVVGCIKGARRVTKDFESALIG